MQYKKLWIALGLVMFISFTVLGVVGYKGIANGPPTPGRVVTADGHVLFTGETIRNGQNVWQSTGGQEIGTIWGHGAYVAPDWSADYLHRQSVIVLDRWARQQGFANYAAMPAESRAALQGRLTEVTQQKPFAFPPESAFTFRPECCSESQRNRVRLQTGIAFTFDRIPQKPCPVQPKARPMPRTTVSGVTRISDFLQPGHMFFIATQNSLSRRPSRGRGRFEWRASSCWRSARFSRMRSPRGLESTNPFLAG